ncbi:uncharacterized protein Dana_GF27730 [Drosophila ananassae]|uniref:Secreted protein n=1 Tax=Drosophila ananassae TaxID=7217 RepID=A0A0P8XFZ6_DROAN|nr:uncharacterized protein Dana_GF27730 [Drosophila ananassae]
MTTHRGMGRWGRRHGFFLSVFIDVAVNLNCGKCSSRRDGQLSACRLSSRSELLTISLNFGVKLFIGPSSRGTLNRTLYPCSSAP